MEINYKLYTDGSKREVNGKMLCVIAGVLLGERNKPVAEFIIEKPSYMGSEELEIAALINGVEIAKQIGVKSLSCFIDNLNTVKIIKNLEKKEENETREIGWKNRISAFDFFSIDHVPREFNTYANALAKYPFNILLKGNPPLAYHGINRSKKRFYTRLKNGLTEDVLDFQQKSRASVYLKFKSTKELLEELSISHQPLEKNKIDKLFKQLYTYFHTVLYTNKNNEYDNSQEENENPNSFIDFLKTTKIDQAVWPEWLSDRVRQVKSSSNKM